MVDYITAGTEASGISELERTLDEAPSEERTFWHDAGEVLKDVLGAYYTPKAFERKDDGRVYRYLGVHLFKKVVPTGGDYVRRIWPKMRIGSLENHIKANERVLDNGLRAYAFSTGIYETVHLLGIAHFLHQSIGDYQERNVPAIAISLAMNLAINIYPIMLQRYNRARIYNCLERMQERKQS